MIEIEKRYSITDTQYENLLNDGELIWSDAERVTDVTFGPSGAESMQIDGYVIRLRKKGNNCSMEYKAPANEEWTKWQEIGVDISSMSSCADILKKIGLQSGLLLDRTRRIASWKGMELSLDRFEYLGCFVEIETSDTNIDMSIFNDFIQRFDIDEKKEAAAYGVLMLEKLKTNPSLSEEIDKYISTL